MRFGKISSAITLESFNNAIKPTTTFFYYGCNFRCGFCHNHIMLTKVDSDKILKEEELISILKHAKRTWKKMITITGGEPTLDPKLPDFLRYLKHEWGFEIKLDSNGSNPEVLKSLIEEGLIDYIAMDIKGTPEQYTSLAKYKNIQHIEKSIEIIKNNLQEYEFRTTIIPNFHTIEDMKKISTWIGGGKRFIIQQFRPDLAMGCLDQSFCTLEKYSKEELETYAEVLRPFFDEVKVR